MTRLEEQLEEKNRLEAEQAKHSGEVNKPEVKIPETPQQRLANTEAEIKAFKSTQDLDSVKLGYENLKVRESTIADREKNLQDKTEKLQKDIGEFELQQKERVAKANEKADEYNEAYNLLKTERAEAKRIMEEAIRKKSEAENIINSQTEVEKIQQEKSEAYTANMEESLKLLGEAVGVLRRQDDGKILGLAVILNNDLYLIQWLQYKKAGLQTLADIIEVDCDRIVEVCEYLQDSKKDYGEVLKYLLDSTEWLSQALCIAWSPPNRDVLRG